MSIFEVNLSESVYLESFTGRNIVALWVEFGLGVDEFIPRLCMLLVFLEIPSTFCGCHDLDVYKIKSSFLQLGYLQICEHRVPCTILTSAM